MTKSPSASVQALSGFEPFSRLTPTGQSLLQDAFELRRCPIGQRLITDTILPETIYVMVEGHARLLGRQHGQPFTIERLGPGSVVGLASLLRAEPCENVAAATDLLVGCIPDSVILELHRKDSVFRDWCSTSLWAAEIAGLLDLLTKNSPKPLSPQERRQLLESLRKDATLVAPEKGIWNELAEDRALLVASSNLPGVALGTQLERGQALPKARAPFPARLIALPEHELLALRHVGDEPVAIVAADAAEGSSSLPLVESVVQPTSLDVGQRDRSQGLQIVRARGVLEETLAVFAMLGKVLDLPYRRDAIDKVLRDKIRRGMAPDLQLCGQIAAMLGLLVTGAKVPAAAATRLITPCLLPWGESFALAVSSNARGLTLASPADGWVHLSPKEISERYPEGLEMLLLERSISTPEQNFGPGWFWPAIRRYRGMLLQVLTASFVVQLFSLANPLLIQVIIDKVISQRSLDTLQVLGIALVVVTFMEGIISSLRTYLFTDTTNRIDMRLGAEVIDRLIKLPLGYFDRRPVGELGTRIAELEKIRNFITGQGLMTILDAAFAVIYIVVMVLYSWLLTAIALAVLPIQIGLTLLGSPLIRRQIRNAAQENAKTQSHLVEVLTGIQTVKAQNVEMVSRWKWQDLYSKYIGRTFEKTLTGTALTQSSMVLQKLSQLLVLWVGASLVLKGELTLGQLIAFRIISGYVTQPLLRLSSIWQNIQELRVSFERLADIVDTPEESDEIDRSKIPLPPVHGDVTFEDLSFRFSPGAPEVLKNINLHIDQGTFVGIVGQSGSGKSTLMKLLPRLYSPTQGRVLIDKYDIDKVELYSLRRQIGIVPQDPLLFSGTISENIALANPDASSDDIVAAARIAEAHNFIMELPAGYSTNVGERGASLSGGQRQRVAIARTLLGKPKLLVMDEATSALDYDTERRVCDNLLESLKDHTVFFITHRLSSIRRANTIVMMHQGAIVEVGSHDELMALKGRYFALYRQQEAS